MAALHAGVLTAETGTGEDAEFFHPRSLRAANCFCYPRSVPAVAQPVTLSYVLHEAVTLRGVGVVLKMLLIQVPHLPLQVWTF
jgi:hypothetical protein